MLRLQGRRHLIVRGIGRLIFLTFLFSLFTHYAWARDWEYYFEYKAKPLLNKNQKIFLDLKEETRYKDGTNYYRKSFFGISKKLNPDLEVAFYYAFKGKKKDDWDALHMFWPQVDSKIHFRRFDLVSSTKLECHLRQDTWNFRQKFKVIFPLGRRLNFFLGDEGRLFSFFGNPYFGQNEALTGFSLEFHKDFSLEICYDLRRTKSGEEWRNTNCLRTVFDFKF